MKKYILSLDEGTTSARAILFDINGKAVSAAQHEFTQIYPQPGYVEHDPMEIFSSQYSALAQAIPQAGISPSEISSVRISKHR